VQAVKSRVEDDVVYLRIISFTEKTYPDMEKSIKKIKDTVPADKMKGYVLDLRLNPGVLLDQAINVSYALRPRVETTSPRCSR
ncbi:S41 family peptidase, partial [Rhizobium ruizarguesonis]